MKSFRNSKSSVNNNFTPESIMSKKNQNILKPVNGNIGNKKVIILDGIQTKEPKMYFRIINNNSKLGLSNSFVSLYSSYLKAASEKIPATPNGVIFRSKTKKGSVNYCCDRNKDKNKNKNIVDE